MTRIKSCNVKVQTIRGNKLWNFHLINATNSSQYSYITYSIKVDGLSNSVIEHEDLSSYPSKTIAFAYWPTGATARSFSQLARIRCPLVPIMSAYPRVFAVHRGNDDDVNVHSLDSTGRSLRGFGTP